MLRTVSENVSSVRREMRDERPTPFSPSISKYIVFLGPDYNGNQLCILLGVSIAGKRYIKELL